VEIPPALAADLVSLTQTLPDPDVDLHQLLSELARGVPLAVPSYLGMSLSVPTGADTDFRATVLAQSARHEDVRASLRWPLTALSGSRAAGTLIFYASSPGAFADLVADLGGSWHLDPGALSLDADLTVPDTGPDTGLAAMASIHQAIGVLIDHGFSPTDAAGELHRRALYTGTSRHATATRLLGDVHPGPGIRSR